MKIARLIGALAAALAALSATSASAGVVALTVNNSWGYGSISYLNYDCLGGSCHIYGGVQDKISGDGKCVVVRVTQQNGAQTNSRVCTSATTSYDLWPNPGNGVVQSVDLIWEGGASAPMFYRY